MTKLSKKIIKDVLPGTAGVVIKICHLIQCSTTAFYTFEAKNPEVIEWRLRERQNAVDRAENTIFEAAAAGNLKAAMYVAKTIGKDRGWVERTESVVTGGLDLTSAREAYLKATREDE